MTDTRTRYTAEYDYPGMLFPESVHRSLSEPTFDAALMAAPDEDGYFSKDGWYAVKVTSVTEKRFTAGDGEETWVKQDYTTVGRWIVGKRVHWTEIEATDRNRILVANIKGNSTDGYGVLTRAGNWQIASDYTAVIDPTAANSPATHADTASEAVTGR